jgi:histidine triad (HIT) family protein
MDECIFCKIVNREVPSQIVYEDIDCVCVLDINPRSKGMCVVIPKQHLSSFNENLELSSKLFDKALIVAEKIKKSLNPLTVFFSVMPAQVPHFHIRVYPVYKDQVPLFENKPIEIEEEELETLAHKIRNATVDWKGRETVKIEEKPKEEKKEEPKNKRSAEDVYWMKRHMQIP